MDGILHDVDKISQNQNSETEEPSTPSEPEEEACTGTTVDNPGEYDYLIGDDVTLSDNSEWVVLKNSKKTDTTIRLISAKNIKNNVSTSLTGPDLFTNVMSEYAIPYTTSKVVAYSSTDYTVYSGSNLENYIKGDVKTALENSLNTTLSYIDIWNLDDLKALGITVEYSSNNNYINNLIYDKNKCWFDKIFKPVHIWTNIKYQDAKTHLFVD